MLNYQRVAGSANCKTQAAKLPVPFDPPVPKAEHFSMIKQSMGLKWPGALWYPLPSKNDAWPIPRPAD